MCLLPGYRGTRNGEVIVRLEVVDPPDADKSVMFCSPGESVDVTLRFGGVRRMSGHRGEVYDTFIQDLVVRTVGVDGSVHLVGDDGNDLVDCTGDHRQFEFFNQHGDRILFIEFHDVAVVSVERHW